MSAILSTYLIYFTEHGLLGNCYLITPLPQIWKSPLIRQWNNKVYYVSNKKQAHRTAMIVTHCAKQFCTQRTTLCVNKGNNSFNYWNWVQFPCPKNRLLIRQAYIPQRCRHHSNTSQRSHSFSRPDPQSSGWPTSADRHLCLKHKQTMTGQWLPFWAVATVVQHACMLRQSKMMPITDKIKSTKAICFSIKIIYILSQFDDQFLDFDPKSHHENYQLPSLWNCKHLTNDWEFLFGNFVTI